MRSEEAVPMRNAFTPKKDLWPAATGSCRWIPLVFLLFTASTWAEQKPEKLQPAIGVIAMLSGNLGELKDRYGAGIVFARKDNLLYIATADHVVLSGGKEMTDIMIRLKAHPDTELPAKLLPERDTDLDLALLEVALPEETHKELGLNFRVLVKPDADLSNSAVYPVGRPGNQLWQWPATPAPGYKRDVELLQFESPAIPGHSGGGLVEESGVLLGMVLNDNPPFGEAVDIRVVIEAIKRFGYPVDLGLTYTYDLASKWEGNEIFPTIIIDQQADQVSGRMSIRCPGQCYQQTQILEPGGIFETEMENILGTSEPIHALVGKTRGNRLLVNAYGEFLKEVTRVVRSGLPQHSQVPFYVRLDGRVKGEIIHFTYKF